MSFWCWSFLETWLSSNKKSNSDSNDSWYQIWLIHIVVFIVHIIRMSGFFLYPMGQLHLTIYVISITSLSIHIIKWTILCFLNSNTIFTLHKYCIWSLNNSKNLKIGATMYCLEGLKYSLLILCWLLFVIGIYQLHKSRNTLTWLSG